MAHFTTAQAQAWAEGTKLKINSIDSELEQHIAGEVLARIASTVDVTGWTNDTNTPTIVRTAITKLYVAWLYNRQYSEDIGGGSAYADKLAANAELLIAGILEGSIDLPGIQETGSGTPAFYPSDASSGQTPTSDDPSLGPAAFSMGSIF